MVLKKARADGTKTPLTLETFGNEPYQAGWLLTRQRARKQYQDQFPKSKSQLNPFDQTVNSKG